MHQNVILAIQVVVRCYCCCHAGSALRGGHAMAAMRLRTEFLPQVSG
jgi:hypothetical protein